MADQFCTLLLSELWVSSSLQYLPAHVKKVNPIFNLYQNSAALFFENYFSLTTRKVKLVAVQQLN